MYRNKIANQSKNQVSTAIFLNYDQTTIIYTHSLRDSFQHFIWAHDRWSRIVKYSYHLCTTCLISTCTGGTVGPCYIISILTRLIRIYISNNSYCQGPTAIIWNYNQSNIGCWYLAFSFHFYIIWANDTWWLISK